MPNGVSNATIIGSANSQFPLLSTSAVLELMTLPSDVVISAVIALPGSPVPKISKKSPLLTTSGIPLIVSGVFGESGILSLGSPILRLNFFSSPSLS